jgi:hypothetical protein
VSLRSPGTSNRHRPVSKHVRLVGADRGLDRRRVRLHRAFGLVPVRLEVTYPSAMEGAVTGGYSWCRHCGRVGGLTFEHVPPRSVGNDSAVGRIDDPFDINAAVQQVAEWDEALACGPCVAVLMERSVATSEQVAGGMWDRSRARPIRRTELGRKGMPTQCW